MLLRVYIVLSVGGSVSAALLSRRQAGMYLRPDCQCINHELDANVQLRR